MSVWVIAIMIAGTTRIIYHPVGEHVFETRAECEANIDRITTKLLGSKKTTCLEMERVVIGEKSFLRRIGSDI